MNSKRITPPPVRGPNVINNPLPNHGVPRPPTINVIHDDSKSLDPSTLITHVAKPEVETNSSKEVENAEATLSFYTSENVRDWVCRASKVEEEIEEEHIAREEKEYREAIQHMHELEEAIMDVKWMIP